MKGTIFFKICFGVFRAIIFFAIFYNPLMTQPRIDEYVVLPIVSIALLVIGILLNVIGTKELVQTKLGGVKGIPDRIFFFYLHREKSICKICLLVVVIIWVFRPLIIANSRYIEGNFRL